MQCAISRMTGLPWLKLATLGFRYTSIFLSFILSSIHSFFALCHSLSLSLFLPLHLFLSSLPFCVPISHWVSPSLLFYSLFQILPVYLFPILYPASFPPCSLYQVLYNVGSPDVLPASIRHFDSVQLSMIMYCSLNHSFFSLPPSPSLFLSASLPETHMHRHVHICCSPCNTRLPWKWQISAWNIEKETHEKRQRNKTHSPYAHKHTDKLKWCVFHHWMGKTLADGPSRSSHQISYLLCLSALFISHLMSSLHFSLSPPVASAEHFLCILWSSHLLMFLIVS